MRECLPGLYQTRLRSSLRSISEINIYLIPGKEGGRSLMVDAGFRDRSCLEVMDQILREMGIEYEKLDIFITHKHHDHSGLAGAYVEKGARILMNPMESLHGYDCLYYSNGQKENWEQNQVLRSVGVTPDKTPEIWEMFRQIRRQVEERKGWEFEIDEFPYTPVSPGDMLEYGDYKLEAVSLKGHTLGQLGLYEKDKRLLFSADAVIDGIVPIAATTYLNQHLLEGYFEVLGQVKHDYRDCLLLPAHLELITDPAVVADRIIFAYLDKIDQIHKILKASEKELTIRRTACRAYGIHDVPESLEEFVRLKMTMSKTFSCLEYLKDNGYAACEERNGTFYWSAV